MSRQVKIIVGAVVGVVLVSVLVSVFVMGRQSSPVTESTSKNDMVRIEIRGMPEMTVKKDGVKLGKTPVSFVVAKSTQPIDIDTEWTEQRIYRTGQRLVPRHAHKSVVPDVSKTVDFRTRDADPVHEDPAATE